MKPLMEADMEMLSYVEASRMLGVPVGTLYFWVSRRRIPHVRLGKRLVRFRRAEIDAWIAKHQVPAVGETDLAGREARP